jgi:hypothetical protein
MTERWRKKLGDLDKVGPSDDVFEHAKEGPMIREDAIPQPRPVTRVVTAIAAFLVFALGISVFVVPALRMGTGPGSAPMGMFPLWPAQTTEELEQLQAAADSGEAAWMLDPEQVAERFGRDVMGWGDIEVDEVPGQLCSSTLSMPSLASGATWSLEPYVGGCVDYVGPPPSSSATASVMFGQALRVYALTWCSGDVCLGDAERVTLYQPLEQGEGRIWTVWQAHAPGITLSATPGQTMHDQDTLSAGFGSRGGTPTLAFASCLATLASSDAVSASDSTDLGGIQIGLGIEIDVALASDNCTGPQAGYAMAVLADRSLASDGVLTSDPLAGGGTGLLGLTALPIVVVFPELEPETTAPASPTPSQEPSDTEWTTYTDPLGWTIDVPSEWLGDTFDREGYTGARFGSGDETYQDGISPIDRYFPDPGEVMVFVWHESGGTDIPRDDSAFPLDYANMDGYSGDFRADGLPFRILIKPGDGSETITPEQAVTVERMIESIRFEPWGIGETREGWTAVGEVLPSSTAEWITFEDEHYFATNLDGGRHLWGPTPTCPGASYEVREYGVAGVVCSDGTGGDWDFAGRPQDINTPGFDVELASYPAVRSWQGMLLVQFPQTQS